MPLRDSFCSQGTEDEINDIEGESRHEEADDREAHAGLAFFTAAASGFADHVLVPSEDDHEEKYSTSEGEDHSDKIGEVRGDAFCMELSC